MKKNIMFPVVFLITFITIPVFAQVAQYQDDDFFTELISNKVTGINQGEAIFIIKNPLATEINADTFNIDIINEKGSDVWSKDYYIERNYTINITDYEQINVKQDCSNYEWNGTDYVNTTGTFDCSYTKQGKPIGYHYEYNLVWEKWNPKGYKLFPGEHKVKIISKWPIEFGEQNKEWIPEITINGTTIKQDKWAFWNTSINYRQPIEINQTGTETLEGFPALLNGTFGIDTATLISDSKLDANGYCMWFVNNGSADAEELYWYYPNETSVNIGINTGSTHIYANVTSVPTSNTTIYMYYDPSCGASSSTTYMDSTETLWNKVMLYDLEEEQGTSISGASETGTIGSLINTPAWTTGKVGYALDFELDSSEYAYIGNYTEIYNIDYETECAWAKVESTSAIQIINKFHFGGVGSYQGTGLAYRSAQGAFQWFGGKTTGNDFVIYTPAISAGAWYFVCGRSNATDVDVSINGSTFRSSAEAGVYKKSGLPPVRLSSAENNASEEFDGIIDQPWISGSYLSDSWLLREYEYDESYAQAGWEEETDVPDTTPPTVDFASPTDANGTEADDVKYINWNITLNESVANGTIEINGTNNSMTCYNATVSYCLYNDTGITTNVTHCATGWASDASDNWNQTDNTICRTTSIIVIPIIPSYPTTSDVYVMYDIGTRIIETKVILNAGITNTTAFWLCTDAACTTTCQVNLRGGLIIGCS